MDKTSKERKINFTSVPSFILSVALKIYGFANPLTLSKQIVNDDQLSHYQKLTV